MNFNNANALNFSYLLLDFYKSLNISESELCVILMLDHLKKQDNDFITTDELLLKMNMSKKDIDLAMTSLYQKKYVTFSMDKGKATTSIRPLEKLLYKKFQQSIFSEEELNKTKELQEMRSVIYDKIHEIFQRDLTPIEINKVDDWIRNGISESVIINSIKDAMRTGNLTINNIDRIIIKKIREEDNNGNAIKK